MFEGEEQGRKENTGEGKNIIKHSPKLITNTSAQKSIIRQAIDSFKDTNNFTFRQKQSSKLAKTPTLIKDNNQRKSTSKQHCKRDS